MNQMHADVDSSEYRKLGIAELDEAGKAALAALPPLISTDSHVMEPEDLWDAVPEPYRTPVKDWLKKVGFKRTGLPPGSYEPHLRVADQQKDGIQAEILFPNDGMAMFGLDDGATQRAAFTAYNNWIAEFCRTSPKNLIGVTCVSAYDIDEAVKELHRGLDLGLVGAMVWQVPDPKLPFTLPHYDKLWAAAAEADAPVHMHILTGHSYALTQGKTYGNEKIRGAVNKKTNDTVNSLFDVIFSGVFDRHPKLKIVLAESECGWLPFILQQWDYYFERFRKSEKLGIDRHPSEIFNDHVYCTWLEDYSGTRQFTWWGQDNLMWSNDYPHPNMTYPFSRQNVLHHIGNLPKDVQNKLIRDNAIRLYGLGNRLN